MHTRENSGRRRRRRVAVGLPPMRALSPLRYPIRPSRMPGASQMSMIHFDASTVALQTFIAFAGFGAFNAFDQRPRGGTRPGVPIVVGPSRVAGAGRGVFAGEDLERGCVLDEYPGRLRPPAVYMRKLQAAPDCGSFCWTLGGGHGVLDPTDASGKLMEPLPFIESLPQLGGSFAVATTLCLINEPPPGSDVNVDSVEEGKVVTFVTGRRVSKGEELFLDYGRNYDRSTYGLSGGAGVGS